MDSGDLFAHILHALHWRHNGTMVSDHRQLRVTSLCEGTGGFLSQRASITENVSIWWRHHGLLPGHWGHWGNRTTTVCELTMSYMSNLNNNEAQQCINSGHTFGMSCIYLFIFSVTSLAQVRTGIRVTSHERNGASNHWGNDCHILCGYSIWRCQISALLFNNNIWI